jgi:putative membrane protein
VSDRSARILLAVVLACLVVSRIGAHSGKIWFAETVPVMLGAILLLATWRRFRLTSVLCWLIAVHAIILIVGGHYTYARVPFGNWLKDLLDLQRNPYDRIGHFAQGVIPAILTREILLRRSPLHAGKWLFFLVTCVCLAFSAFYELVEWQYAVRGGDGSMDFLGVQGDVWDAQWDMFMALVGAVLAQLTLDGVHNRQLAALAPARVP